MNWSIEQLSVIDDDNLSNVVRLVQWKVEKDGHDMSAFIRLPEPSEDFIAFESLDESTVLGWVWGVLDKAEVERKLNDKIQQDIPIKANLPWEN